MLFPIVVQARLFIFSLTAGFITGLLFDVYRLFRGFENPNKILTFIQDILFWIFTAIVVFIFLAYTKSTYLSGYAYMFICIGVLVYLKLVSRLFLSVQYKIVNFIIKFIRIIFNFMIYPINILFYKIKSKKKRN